MVKIQNYPESKYTVERCYSSSTSRAPWGLQAQDTRHLKRHGKQKAVGRQVIRLFLVLAKKNVTTSTLYHKKLRMRVKCQHGG